VSDRFQFIYIVMRPASAFYETENEVLAVFANEDDAKLHVGMNSTRSSMCYVVPEIVRGVGR
jgi:hypothetical protein